MAGFLFGAVTDGVVPLFAEQFAEQLALMPALIGGFDVAKLVDPIEQTARNNTEDTYR